MSPALRPRPGRALAAWVPRVPSAVLATALAADLAGGSAWAFDAEVRSETISQAYQVRGPAGAPVLSFRRITENLSLTGAALPDDPHGVTWTLRARLRIDSDFGSACDPATNRCLDELNTSRAAEFAPLFAQRAIDLPFAYLDGTGFFRGRADVRFGRQMVVDPMGFFLFDGARVRLHLGSAVSLDTYGGLESRAGFPLSSGRYERDGLIRADRSGWDPALAPQVADRALAGTLGFAGEYASDALFVRAAYRRVWSADGVSEEKLGGSADITLSRRTRAFADIVYSAPQGMLTDLSVGAEWRSGRGHVVGAEAARYRPSFDVTSVWASFWTDPTDDLRLHTELPLGRGFTAVASALLRRYALSEGTTVASPIALPDLWAGGGGAAMLYRRGRWDGSLRARAEGGAPGTRAGVDLTARVWLLWQRIRADLGASAWTVTDTLRPDRDLTSLGLLGGVLVRLGTVASVHVDLEDDMNRLVGHRVRAMATLDLRSPL